MSSSKQDASRHIGNNVKGIEVEWSVKNARNSGLVDIEVEMPESDDGPFDVAEFVGVLYDNYTVMRLKTHYSKLLVTITVP